MVHIVYLLFRFDAGKRGFAETRTTSGDWDWLEDAMQWLRWSNLSSMPTDWDCIRSGLLFLLWDLCGAALLAFGPEVRTWSCRDWNSCPLQLTICVRMCAGVCVWMWIVHAWWVDLLMCQCVCLEAIPPAWFSRLVSRGDDACCTAAAGMPFASWSRTLVPSSS
jgi:hypothetical protein